MCLHRATAASTGCCGTRARDLDRDGLAVRPLPVAAEADVPLRVVGVAGHVVTVPMSCGGADVIRVDAARGWQSKGLRARLVLRFALERVCVA